MTIAVWVPALYVAAGACACSAVHHLLIALRKPGDFAHLTFALLSVMGAVFFFCSASACVVSSSAALVAIRRVQMAAGLVFIAVLPWFILHYCQLRARLLPSLLSAWLTAVLIAHLLLPYGMEFNALPPFRYQTLPWGERIVDLRIYERGVWHYAWWVGIFEVFAYAAYACTVQCRSHLRKRALILLTSLGIFFVFLLLQFAIDHRWIEFTNLGEFGFLALLLTMSFALTRQIRESERRLQLVVDNVPAAVYLKDLDGRYLLVNRECEQRLARTRRQLLGKTDHDLFPVPQADAVRMHDAQVLRSTSPIQFEEQITTATGESLTYLSLKLSLRHPDGAAYAVCGVSTDVTRLRASEREMRSLRRQLWHSDRVARIGALAASLAHELNQPLAAILSNAQAGLRFLERGSTELKEIREILADVVRDDKRAAAVISGLRALVRRAEPAHERVDIAAVLRELLDLMNTELIVQNISVDTEFEPGCYVLADKAQIQQVSLNLVMNAIDAMREQPMGERRLVISVGRRNADTIRVALRDSGMGIALQDLARVFDAFWTSKGSGMGLGLAISRSIVEAHGGVIHMQPNDDRGVTVAFELPTNVPAGLSAEAASAKQYPSGLAHENA